jgi:methyl-accepting chemotaxis protein
MSIRFKFLSAIALCIVAFIAFSSLAWNTVVTTKVTGAHYQSIVTSKDLIADILPPPEYIVETYLVVYQLVDETDPAKQKALVARLRALRHDFDDRHEFWTQTLSAGHLQDQFLNVSYQPAVKFFEVTETQVLPAVEHNERDKARAALRDLLLPLYEKHRAAIEEVVNIADGSLKKEEAEVAALVSSRGLILVVLGTTVLFAMFLSAIFVNHVTSTIIRRLSHAGAFASAMAKGDMSQELEPGPADEVGQLSVALNEMKSNMRRIVADILRSSSTLDSASAGLSKLSNQTSDSSKGILDKASMVAAAAEESSTNTESVAANISDTSRNLESVATATQQMSDAASDIATNSARARAISDEASKQSQAIYTTMRQLGQAASDIGKVTESIRGISAQTSLLALNATIEAARAGAAGKGFAVVANEVKELSQQAASATEDIKSKVTSVQASADGAITDIERVSAVVKEVNDIIAGMASAVEEQSSATRDVARNIAQASSAVQEANIRVAETATVSRSIAKDVAGVHASVVDIREGGDQVKLHAESLANLAKQLSKSVGQFKL